MKDPMDYVAALSLTFEQANLISAATLRAALRRWATRTRRTC